MYLANRSGGHRTDRRERCRVFCVRRPAGVKSTFCYIPGRRNTIRVFGEPRLKRARNFCVVDNLSAGHSQHRLRDRHADPARKTSRRKFAQRITSGHVQLLSFLCHSAATTEGRESRWARNVTTVQIFSSEIIRNILSGCVFAEFPVPLEHPRAAYPAFDGGSAEGTASRESDCSYGRKSNGRGEAFQRRLRGLPWRSEQCHQARNRKLSLS